VDVRAPTGHVRGNGGASDTSTWRLHPRGGEIGERLARLVEKKVAQGVKVNSFTTARLDRHLRTISAPGALGAKVCEFNPVNRRRRRDWTQQPQPRQDPGVDGRGCLYRGINISSAIRRVERVPSRSQVKRESTAPRLARHPGAREGPVVARFQRLPRRGRSRTRPAQQAAISALAEHGAMRSSSDTDPGVEPQRDYAACSMRSARSSRCGSPWATSRRSATLEALLARAPRRDVRRVLPGFSDFWAPVYARVALRRAASRGRAHLRWTSCCTQSRSSTAGRHRLDHSAELRAHYGLSA